MDAPLFRLGAQGAQVVLRAQHGVDHPVVRGVVPVAAGGVENWVQVDGGDGQALQIVQLSADASQAAAEEIAVPPPRQRISAQPGYVVPDVMYRALAQQPLGVRDSITTETVWKNLVCHPLAEPLRRGAILIHRKLPRLAVIPAAQAVAAQIDAAAVGAGEAEGVPHQLRRVRRGERAGKALRTGRERRLAADNGKFAVGHQRAGAVLRPRRDGEGHRRTAADSPEGGFVFRVTGIENGHRHVITSAWYFRRSHRRR